MIKLLLSILDHNQASALLIIFLAVTMSENKVTAPVPVISGAVVGGIAIIVLIVVLAVIFTR